MIFTLVKVNLRALFAGVYKGGRSGKKKKSAGKRTASAILIGLLIVYAAGAIMFSMGMMFNSLCAPLFEAGVGWFFFALAGIIIFALGFIGGVFMVQTQIFNARDNELLLSMPIRPSAILAGRLSALLIMEYAYEAIVFIPALVVLIANGYISRIPAPGIVFFFAEGVLLPLIALALGCFVGWVAALASSRMRKKNIVNLILSVAFLIAYFWLYMRMMGNMGALIANGAEIAEAVRRAVFPAYHLGLAAAEGNALSFLIFAACAVLPFVLMCMLLSWSFIKLTTGGRGAKKTKYREKTLRVSGARSALLRREMRYYWSAPMYIMNSSLGAIATLILTVVLIVRPGLVTGLFDPATGMLAGVVEPGFAAALVLAVLGVMNFVAAPSVSLEGKNLWIVKSLPVKAPDILLSKVLLHLVVCGIPTLAAGVACIALFPVRGALQIILTLVLPATVTLLFAFIGVTLNLAFPRFDWINPIQPVKQGASAMLSMFGGMALVVVLALVYILALSSMLELGTYMLLCALLFIAASAALYLYLIRGGARKFEAL